MSGPRSGFLNEVVQVLLLSFNWVEDGVHRLGLREAEQVQIHFAQQIGCLSFWSIGIRMGRWQCIGGHGAFRQFESCLGDMQIFAHR